MTVLFALFALSVLIVAQLCKKEIIERELAVVKQKVHEFLRKFLLSKELNFESQR